MGVLDLGAEFSNVLAPTALCMAITCSLVRTLNPLGRSDSHAVWLAQVYPEEDGASNATNFLRALLNSGVFVLIVAMMTFALALCYKHGGISFIKCYMGFSCFSIFFVLTGLITFELLQKAAVPLDAVTFLFSLCSFASVGTLTLFFWPAPLSMRQAYLMWTAVATAFIFSWLPSWTCWVLIVAMAIYDIAAVLAPGGPLKMLVELAEERDEPIPALVFEGRPVHHRVNSQPADLPEEPPALPDASPERLAARRTLRAQDSSAPQPEDEEALALLPPDAGAQDEEEFMLPDSIKLGLGDFIFYSLLLVRASQSGGWIAALAAFLAILAGLGATLAWLGLAQKALPALPVSIAAAFVCYALTVFALQPVLLPSVTLLVTV